MVKLMLPMLILTLFLSLLPPSSSAGPSLVFTAASPGLAQLEDITVDGELTLSLSFKTGASEAQLLYMRELTAGNHISLFLSDGGLHLQVNQDTLIVSETGVDDNQWHNMILTINAQRDTRWKYGNSKNYS